MCKLGVFLSLWAGQRHIPEASPPSAVTISLAAIILRAIAWPPSQLVDRAKFRTPRCHHRRGVPLSCSSPPSPLADHRLLATAKPVLDRLSVIEDASADPGHRRANAF